MNDGMTWQERRRLRQLIAASSVGDSAWADCPRHGAHQPVEPFDDSMLCCGCSNPKAPEHDESEYRL